MADWSTYSVDDFILFSPETYLRLFELHNAAHWPLHIMMLVFGSAIAFAAFRPTRRRVQFCLFALSGIWMWMGWSYFWERYASINWVAAYVAPFIALEGVALSVVAVSLSARLEARGEAGGWPRAVLATLCVVALLGYPLLAPVLGRPLAAMEVFGIFPDPTALVTLAVLGALPIASRWALMILPAAWLFISASTLWLLQTGGGYTIAGFALTIIGAAIMNGMRRA